MSSYRHTLRLHVVPYLGAVQLQALAGVDLDRLYRRLLEETLEILSDPRFLDEVRKGDQDVKAGRIERLSRDELLARRAGK